MTIHDAGLRPGPADEMTPPGPALTFQAGEFLRNGQPHRIIAGSIHYFRVHPTQWADRLARLVALGANTVDTYVAWNFHERTRGEHDFSAWRDLGQFIDLAQEAGLDVIVRPGPYICAEWDNGGLPSWVTRGRPSAARCTHPDFLSAVADWFDALLPLIVERQASHGGPVVAVQIENEYGSFGDDSQYMEWIRQALREGGVTEFMYTADGPTPLMLDGGTLEDTFAAATFGSRAATASRLFRERRPGEPFFCAEFWNGWFDHWGEGHHTRDAADAAASVGEILDLGGSVSLYMAHGGTNFGLTSGANHDGTHFQPTVTSYDSDAPISESGGLTEKFWHLRDQFQRFTGACEIESLTAQPRTLEPLTAKLTRTRGLLETLRNCAEPVRSPTPLTFEDLELDAGLLLYRARPVLPPGEVPVTLVGLRDRAHVFVDGVLRGIVSRNDDAQSVALTGAGEEVLLEIVVENQGRINYGHLLGEGKGLDAVLVERRLIFQWDHIAVPLDRFTPADLGSAGREGNEPDQSEGAVAAATFEVAQPLDAFLALPDSGKGFVWVNDFLLGRYWERGPQETLYIPAALFRVGDNTVTILDLERVGDRVELRAEPQLGPPQQHVETFDQQ